MFLHVQVSILAFLAFVTFALFGLTASIALLTNSDGGASASKRTEQNRAVSEHEHPKTDVFRVESEIHKPRD